MSDKINVLVTLPFTETHQERLAAVSERLEIKIIHTQSTGNIPPEVWKDLDILYTDDVLPKREEAPNLKWIQFHWAGINHANEHPILADPDPIVTTLSGAAASKAAEFAVLLMLASGHRIPAIVENQRRREWPKDRWEKFLPVELRGHVVGIYGYGSIGRQIARLLQPFGANVLATKFDATNPADRGYYQDGWGDATGELALRVYPPEALTWVAKESDFFVVAVPLTPKTKGSVNEEIFDAMKTGAYLIDISRGGVVDHQALIQALKEHKLAGAALDVFPTEPLSEKSPLWKMPNVLITPHVAGITAAYDDRAAELFAENLKRYVDGEPLLNLYSRELNY